MRHFTNVLALAGAVAGCRVCLPLPLLADSTPPPTSQRSFSSPEEAVKTLATAAAAGDRAAVDGIFGPDIKDLLSGDARQDSLEFAEFSKLIAQYSQLTEKETNRYIVNLGSLNWPFPIPLVKKGDAWVFDTEAGKDEIVNRRVGEDELAAINICRAYVAAQHEYSSEDRSGDGVFKFAQKFRSTPGKKDGLYWTSETNEEQSPFGPLIAEVHAEGYGGKTAEGTPQPYHGYRFKILTAQGAAAPGGKFNYIINGNMIAGFGMVAYPAHWGESGVMTFIVNQWGKVYQRNLGPKSAAIGAAMTEFNPGHEWVEAMAP